MKKLKNLIALIGLLMLIFIALPSCGGEEDDEICKVSVVSGVGGTAFASETEVMLGWEVTLTAQPEPDYRFLNWTVNGVEVSTENPYTTTVTENTQFKANFKNIYSGDDNGGGDEDVVMPDIVEGVDYTLNIYPLGGGKVTTDVQSMKISLFAEPAVGYKFVGWKINGEEVSNETKYKTIIEEFTQIEAIFEKDEPATPEMTYVDLGLSVKWATCNLGAESYYESGDYYAWGEIASKEDHNYWKNYIWCNGSENSITKYCTDSEYGKVDNKTTLDLEDDAAHVALGGNWRMPTAEEYEELLRECVWYWVELNGVYGYKVISFKTEKFIFLPATGVKSRSYISGVGTMGSFWTSTLSSSSNEAKRLIIFNGDAKELGVSVYERWIGYPIRPVYAE